METFIRVKAFDKLQHYKQRTPPWIKLYNDTLDDYQWAQISDVSKGHLIGLMLLASRLNNQIPNDPSWIAGKIGAKSKVNLQELIDFGYIEQYQDATLTHEVREQSASNMLADCKQSACLEREGEREESRGETTLLGKKPNVASSRDFKKEAIEVLLFLNEKTGRNYATADSNLEFIIGRLKEAGVTVGKCRSIIAKKAREWINDENMNKYLRPATLFNRTKFWQYEGELIKQPTQEVSNESAMS